MTVVSKQVSASSDDCLVRENTALFQFVNPTAGDVSSSNFGYQGGMRFLGFANSIKSATIFEAKLTLTAAFDDGTLPPLEIIGEAKKDPATFVDKADFDARARTTAKVAWNPSSWPSVDDTIVTVDITSVISEILALWDGVSTDIVIFIQDTTPLTYGGVANTRVGWQDFDDAPAGTKSAILTITHTNPSVIMSGTIVTAPPNQVDIRVGGKTIILTTNGTWAAAGATFNAERQGIIDGLTSDLSESTGWNAVGKPGIDVSDVVRDSDTQVTITLTPITAYGITATETITATIPASAIDELSSPEVATPTFAISAAVTGTFGDVLDTLVLASGGAPSRVDVAHVIDGAVEGEDIFAVVYHIASAANVILETVAIDEAGNISAVLDTQIINTEGSGGGPSPTIVKITDGIVACAYNRQTASLSEITTWAISNTGAITNTPIDTQSGGTVTGVYVRIRKTHHTDLYTTTKQRFNISRFFEVQTFTIDVTGAISAELDIQIVDTGIEAASHDITHAIDNVYACAFANNSSTNGFMKTITIDSAGLISAVIDTFEYDNAHGFNPHLSGDGVGTVIMMHEGSNPSQGRIRTISIQSNGTIDGIDQTLDKSDASTPFVLKIANAEAEYLIGWPGNLTSISVDGVGAMTTIGSKGVSLINDSPGFAYKPFSAVMAFSYTNTSNGVSISTIGLQADLDPPAASITGTIIPADETEVRGGGSTIIITLTGRLWDGTIGANNSKTQDLINGLTSGGSEVAGWNAEVRDQLTFNDVNRNSDTVVTILLPAFPLYDTSENETITLTVPDSALQ